MTRKPDSHPNPATLLRRAAERRVRARTDDGETKSVPDAPRLLHELEVHQIELEMQNAELCQSRDRAAELLERYTNLYERAPMAYVTLDGEGAIRQINPAGARLLETDRPRLLGRLFASFVAETDRHTFDDYLRAVLASDDTVHCEVTLSPHGIRPSVASVEGVRSADGGECRLALLDISGQKQAEALSSARILLAEYATDHSSAEVLEQSVRDAVRLTGSTWGFGGVVEADQATISLQAWSIDGPDGTCAIEGPITTMRMGPGLLADVIRDAQPVIHNDCASLPQRRSLPAGHVRLTRVLMVPVVRNGSVEALFGVGNRPVDYSPSDSAFLSKLAGHAWTLVLAKRSREIIDSQLKELRQWHGVTLGREDRVRLLKAEVNELLKRLGAPPRYASEAADSDPSPPPAEDA